MSLRQPHHMKTKLLPAALLVASLANASPLDPEFLGTWGPAAAPCRAKPRLIVHDSGLRIQGADGTRELAGVDACRTCAGGVRYSGPEVTAIFGLDTPDGLAQAVVSFNVRGKLGLAELEVQDRSLLASVPSGKLLLAQCTSSRQ